MTVFFRKTSKTLSIHRTVAYIHLTADEAFGNERNGLGNGAGWSSPVARQAHNLKVTGSNPVPATNGPTSNRGAAFVSDFKISL